MLEANASLSTVGDVAVVGRSFEPRLYLKVQGVLINGMVEISSKTVRYCNFKTYLFLDEIGNISRQLSMWVPLPSENIV